MTFRRERLIGPCIAFLMGFVILVLPAPFRCAAQSVSSAPATVQATNPATLQPGSPASAEAYSLPPDKLAKAIALGRIRNVLGLGGSLWDIAVLWLLLATRGAAGLEAWAGRVSRQRRWLQGVLFFTAFLVILTLVDLPLDLYGHHVSHSYGISVEGWGAWFVDMTKSFGFTLVVGVPVLLLFNWIVRRWPRRYWLVCWMAAVPLIVLSVFLEPLAEPIFNQYEPLAKNHAALVFDLEKVVARTGTNIPADRMFLMKASEKSNGINAYVSGIGATKRIVVWDTTADRIPNDEIMLVFAHESGHYVLQHIPKGLAISAVVFFFVFWVGARVAGWLVRRCGVRWQVESISTRTGFVALLFVASIAQFLIDPIGNAVSRHFEHQADVFGQEAVHSLVRDPQKTAVAAFNALGEAWLDDPTPHPFIEFWLDNHPSIQSRANFAAHYDPWANGGHGEFFDK